MSRCFAIPLLLLFALPSLGKAQDSLALCTRWLATVDEASQQIILRWHPSPDSSVTGYHICTGAPCVDYDTVFGRLDTTYVCADHDPLQQHTYRLHVFDSINNVSPLTPYFGNMVLSAEVPECETQVSASWNPYIGFPSGLPHYELWVKLEPFDENYERYYQTSDSNALSYSFEIPEGVTYVWLKVLAISNEQDTSQSNIVNVQRLTVDHANFLAISNIAYDTFSNYIQLSFHLDTSFREDHYSLYRSIDGSPWREIGTFHHTDPLFRDHDINPYDSLHCYQIGVKDACLMNEQYSASACVVVPDPPKPSAMIPNIIIVGDERNGTFRPVVSGLMGDLYELYLYNRTGMLVFHTSNHAEGWRPSANTPQGVYTYLLRCRLNTGYIQTLSGTVAVIK